MRPTRSVLALLLSSSLLCAALQARAQDPVLPDRSWSDDTVGRVISPAMGEGENHNQPSAIQGALLLAGNGVHSLWDIADPTRPAMLSTFESPHHDGESESHQLTYLRDESGAVYALMISGRGVDVFDLTDVRSPRLVSSVELEGIDYGDNTEAVWGVAWLGDTIYVGGTNTGLHVVDATDPAALRAVTRLPTSELGGVDAGPLFLLGDVLLVTTPKERAGLATLDLTDRQAPALLDALLDPVDSYIGGFYGRHALLISPYRAYDVLTDPRDIRLVATLETQSTEYVSFGDGRLFLGGLRPSPGAYEYDISNPLAPVMVQRIVGRTDRFGGVLNDDQFTVPIGNLLVLGDDQIRLGSVLAVHDARRDSQPPEVAWASPADGATSRPASSTIGLSFTDQIELRSVTDETFIVRPIGGAPLRGRVSLTHTLLSFAPSEPLAADTTYEVVLPAGGVTDLVGNALAAEWRTTFSTGTDVVAPTCRIAPSTPAEVTMAATLTADDAGAGATYSWDLGDGTTAAGSPASHAYAAPGRYVVRLTVEADGARRTCSATQIVHAPLAPTAPTRSSTVVTIDGSILVVSPDTGTVTAVADDTLEVRWEAPVGRHPRTVAAAPDGTIWVTAQDDDLVTILDAAGARVGTITLPHGAAPYGVTFDALGERALVTLEGRGALAVISVETREIAATIALGPSVRGVATLGSVAYVTRFRSGVDHGEVYEVDLASLSLTRTIELALDPGPDDADTGRGVPNYLSSIAITPDGARAFIPSKKDNTGRGVVVDGQPLDDDSTVRTIVSQIDLAAGAEDLAARVDLDDHDMASAVAFSPLGDLVFIATTGTNRVDVYDTASARLVSGFATSLAPQGLWLEGGRLYVQCFTARALDVVDVSTLLAGTDATARPIETVGTVGTETLTPEELLGAQIFYNADDPRMSADGYVACASCHLDGDSDGRVWDFTDRGEGLRNTIDLRGRAGTAHGPVHWTANFDEIQDFENDIRFHFGGSGFMTNAEFEATSDTLGAPKAGASAALDALAAYVATFDEFPRSPHRNADGTLTEAAVRGREVFESLDCLSCHRGERLTDSGAGSLHDVGTLLPSSGMRRGEALEGLDTPTLRGLFASAPYLHDGSAETLEDVLENPAHGSGSSLDAEETADLVAFLLELENEELGYPETVATPPGSCGCRAGRADGSWSLAGLVLALLALRRVRRRRGRPPVISRRSSNARLAPFLFALVAALGCNGPSGPTCSAEDCVCGPAGCACPNGSSCGWTADVGCAADGSDCHLQCAGGTCVASCTARCEAACTRGASCEVVGTEDTRLYCSRSTCDILGTAGTSATCTDAATCRVHCEAGPCGIDCSEGSTCMLRCPGEAAFRTVTSATDCPASP